MKRTDIRTALTRRRLLARSSMGLGAIALNALLHEEARGESQVLPNRAITPQGPSDASSC